MRYRVGRYTTGIAIILIGVITLLGQVIGDNWLHNMAKFWPLILVGYGLEYLWASRKEERASFDIGGAILVFIILMFTTVFSFVGGTHWGFSFGWEEFIFEEEPVVVDNPNIASLLVDTVNGDITVEPGTDDKITIYATYRIWADNQEEALERKENLPLLVREEGNRLIAKVDYPRFIFGFMGGQRVDLRVVAPKDIRLQADTTNGGITVQGMDQIELLDTTNGRIYVSNSKGNATLDTTNGKIEVENFSGALNADTTNGAIIASGEVMGDWIMDTTNGKIEVTIPEDGSYEYQFENSNGSIDVPNPFLEGKEDKHYYKGSYRGGQYKLKLDTTNGSISVNFR